MKEKLLTIDTFIDNWLEQETIHMNDVDKEKYTDEIADALNFEEIFEVINLWSKTDYIVRIKNFLVRNNFTLDADVLQLLEKNN